jgi:lactate racemase
MKLQFEYGQGFMDAELPDETTEVFIPGQTVPDPPFLADPVKETRKAILHPDGVEPIAQQVGKGSKVVVIFPDRVKGGSHASSHRKVSIPLVLDECLKAGVEKKDILLICSNGLHRKNTPNEIKGLLGEQLFNEYYYTHQIINHDSEDWSNLVDLGFDEQGDPVIMNKAAFEADLTVTIGHVLGNPYGGYSGGYKHVATGITHWKSIASHHIPHVMHREDFTPVSGKSLMRSKFDAIGMYMEQKMGRKFFMVDAVLDTHARQIAVFAGSGEKIQKPGFRTADRRTYVPWAEKKFDVMVFGMPQSFHYGNGMGTNPIFMLQAISAQIIRHRRVLSDNPVIICSSICNGYFHDEEFPSYRALYELFQKDYHQILPDCEVNSEYFAMNQEYIDKYRFNYGFHPYHGFSMISCGHIAEMESAAVYIVGAYEPGYARGMGMKTRATFADALKDAQKYTGPSPRILALPKAFTCASVHLMMKDARLPEQGHM